jgi:hypothetical protein
MGFRPRSERRTKCAHMKWYWPKVTGLKEAERAAHEGAGVCFVIAAFTAIVAGTSFWLNRPVLGLDAWAFADAMIFAIAGWRVWQLSRVWAVLVLVIYIMEKVYAITSGPVPPAGAFISVVFTLLLIGGVRGTFAYYAFKKKESAAATGAPVGGSQ